MNYKDLREAITDAEKTVSKGDQAIRELAELCGGRLQRAGVREGTLCRLKRELAGFNMTTCEWGRSK